MKNYLVKHKQGECLWDGEKCKHAEHAADRGRSAAPGAKATALFRPPAGGVGEVARNMAEQMTAGAAAGWAKSQ